MGVVNTEEPEISIEMTSKPKERQFQVVPVPGVFTRGRWKCWDYRDEPVMDDKILNYADKADKLTPTNKETNEPVIQVNKLYILLFEPGTANLITAVPIANEGNLNNVNTVLDVPTVVEPLSKTASEPQLPFESSGILPSNPNPSQGVLPSVASEGSTLMPKESSTIVVTSIAPATATPSNISSLPVTAATSPEPTFESTNQIPVVSSTLTILSEGEASNPSVSLSPPVAHCSTTATISLGGSASPQPGTSSTTFVGSTNMTANVPNPSVISCTGPGGIGQTSRQILNRETAGAQFKNTSSPVLSRQTSLASFSEGAVASIPMLSPIESVLEDATVVGSTASGPNVVAIDNKIEQAMDLVKTHLTFAVREEVEILRSAIVELEAKVSQLESQNQLLRQFAPAEVLANLSYYIQKKKEAQQVTIGPSVSVPPVAFQGMSVPVQQTISASTPSLSAQHAASLLQSSLNQQVAALTQQQQQQQPQQQSQPPQQQPNVIQATIQQQTLTAQKTTLLAQASASSTQLPQMMQQAVATKHVSNIAVATLPIGSNEVLLQAQQQQQPPLPSNVISGQLKYADPNDSKLPMM